jgi:hypothetical protein
MMFFVGRAFQARRYVRLKPDATYIQEETTLRALRALR